MHTAPPVSYPVQRSRFAATLALLLWTCGAAAVAAWFAQVPAPPWQRGLAILLLLAVGGLAAAVAWHAPRGSLAWDGQRWWWQPQGGEPQAGLPHAVLDLQSRLLLHWHSDTGERRWFWLERTHAPLHWRALRRAVYSRAANAAAPGA